MILWRALIVWLAIISAETFHGVLRAVLLVPVAGDFRARQISVFTGSLLIIVIAGLFIRWLRATQTRHLLAIGILWAALTVLFEIVLGRWILGYSWGRIGSDYDFRHGGLLGIGLVILALAPWIAAKLRGAGVTGGYRAR